MSSQPAKQLIYFLNIILAVFQMKIFVEKFLLYFKAEQFQYYKD